jgi:glycosyltransferase involved in cell wall biosynthesis
VFDPLPIESTELASWVFIVPWELHLPGGVNQVVQNLFRQMRAAGELRPLLMVAGWSPLRPVEKMVDGHPTTYMALRAPWLEDGSILAPFKWLALAPLQLFFLWRLVRRQRVAAFNFHYPSLAVFPIALLRWLGLYRGALILSFHGSDLRPAQQSDPIARLLWRFVLRRTTALVATSQDFAHEAAAFVGDVRCPVIAIHNGLDVEHFMAERDSGGSLPDGLRGREYIVCVANWQHVKGVDVLLRAFASLSHTRPGIALALLGAPGPASDDLRALAREIGVADATWFCESVPHAQVGLFLERARLLCLPSRSESFGVVLLEAGAYGLPVVATHVGGIPEIVTDGETGLLVPPEDAQALAKALEQLLSDPDRARRLGENLRRRVVADFSWSRAYRDYRELLQSRTERG